LIAWTRLTLKLHRFELALLTIALIILAASMGVVAAQLSAIAAVSPECFGSAPGGSHCPDVLDMLRLPDQIAETLLRLTLAVPLVGVVLGAPIVAREIEAGTAQFTWAFAESRIRWAIARSAPVALVLFCLLSVVGWASEGLAHARSLGQDLGFTEADVRGLAVPLRGVLAFAAALLGGAILGRVLPALLVAIPLYAGALLVIALLLSPWRSSEAIVRPMGLGEVHPGALVIEPVAILPDGTVIPEDRADGLPEGSFQDGLRFLPASAAPTWIMREHIAILLMTLILGVAGLAVTRRRRPLG
jgi:hypothetical protein